MSIIFLKNSKRLKELNMKEYYIRDKKSPFYKYMQNIEKENLLSEQEKYETYHAVIANLVFTMFEGGEITEDEKNFAVYAAFNNLEINNVLTIVMKESLGLDIDFNKLEKNNNYILPMEGQKSYDQKNN